jgi:hypothetical protein
MAFIAITKDDVPSITFQTLGLNVNCLNIQRQSALGGVFR